MARIRSVHPGQWNDDDFLECSAFARLLCIAIRNFSDDNGVFEWKPKQLKRLCLPSDYCDVAPLLKELIDHNQIIQFSHEGREYAAVRNFRPWQRPKAPKYVYPCPPDILKYVGLSGANSGNRDPSDDSISEIDRGGGGPFLRKGELSPQREEGGGRMEDGGDSSSLRSDSRSKRSNDEPPGFAEWYEAYPRKKARPHAAKAYAAALKRGASADILLVGAKRYAEQEKLKDPQFTKHPATWLNADGWLDEEDKTTNGTGTHAVSRGFGAVLDGLSLDAKRTEHPH